MLYIVWRKGVITLRQKLYHTGQFAKRASVTLRTLRHYDKVGLLSPSQHTESGYRLYSEEDLLTLQHILALKFLGFSLQEIRFCIQQRPRQLEEVLARQRAMMEEKRARLDSVVKAIQETESLLQAGRCDWDAIARVIQVIQMEKTTDWVKKYFTDEQRAKMEELGAASYSAEALAKLAQGGSSWTEEDQAKASRDWEYVATESKRLADAGADPGGDEAQALAKFKSDLLFAFTQGDPDVESGLGRFWENFHALPASEQPFDASPYSSGDAGAEFLEKAMTIYRERQAGDG